MPEKKILIVDDDPDLVKLLKIELMANKYQVITALDGNDGLKKAQSEGPDLILLDILMPGMDGTIIAETLKNDPLTSQIPIVFLTCLVQKRETEEGGHKIGGNIFIAKPFEKKELLITIAESLGR